MTVIPMHLCVLLYTFNAIKRAINIVFSVTLVLKSHIMWMGIRIHDDDADGWYPATPGRSWNRQKITDSSSDSDSRQNG